MDLSIVVVNWNTKSILRDCLSSVFEETKGISFEAIVVDNGSTDGSVEMVKRQFPEVQLVKNEDNIGYSKANNQGIKISTGRYVCLLNSDTIVLEDAFEKMLCFLDSNPEIGATTCLHIDPKGSPQFRSALGEPNLLYMISVETRLYRVFPKSKFFGKPLLSYLDHSIPHEVEVCPSAIIVIRKKMIEEIGLLDEKIFFGVVDWDYSYRARKKGWKLYFYPGAKVIHYGEGKSKKPILHELLMRDYWAQYYYYWKTYGRFKMSIFRLLIIILSSIKLAVLSMGLLLRGNRKVSKKTKARIETYSTRLRVGFSKLRFN